MSFTIPAAGQHEPEAAGQEPEISVPVSVIGDAAELMTLVAELIGASRDGVIRERIEALLDAKGAEAGPAADWMITSVRALANQADAILSREGMACDGGLARYWRRPQEGRTP